jgi:hypothetical protein
MKLTRKRIIAASLLLVLPFGVIWAKRAFLERWSAIAATGGQSFTVSPIPTPHYLQKDERWKNETVGGTGERLARVGCAVCSLAMALDHYGVQISPKELNDFLKHNDGYTMRGWLKWNAVSRFDKGKVEMGYIGRANFGRIDQALERSDPVIAKIYINSIIPHWVLLVGKQNTSYLMRDPLDDKRSVKPLSDYGSKIYAMRTLKSTDSKAPGIPMN